MKLSMPLQPTHFCSSLLIISAIQWISERRQFRSHECYRDSKRQCVKFKK